MAKTDLVVAELRRRLQQDGRASVKLKTMVNLAGQQKRSPKLLTEIGLALEEAGIYHSPRDLLNCPIDDRVLISSEPLYDTGLPFGSERLLSEFIARHFRLLPPFRHCTSVEPEFRIGDLRVDLVFREANGDRIFCELELGDGKFEAGAQIISYVRAGRAWAQTQPSRPGIRGVVITGAPNPGQETMVAEWCRSSGEDITWFYYRLGLELTASERLGRSTPN